MPKSAPTLKVDGPEFAEPPYTLLRTASSLPMPWSQSICSACAGAEALGRAAETANAITVRMGTRLALISLRGLIFWLFNRRGLLFSLSSFGSPATAADSDRLR